MTLSIHRLPKSARKYLRARKAEIRRGTTDIDLRTQSIKELYDRVSPPKRPAKPKPATPDAKKPKKTPEKQK